MNNMETIQIEVPKSVAKKLKQNQFLEVATRTEKAKFDAFNKYRILSDAAESQKKASELGKDIASRWSHSDATHMMNRYVKNIRDGVTSLSKTAADMSLHVEEIYKKTNAIKALSCLNTGLSLANVAVDLIGFAVVCKKLNALTTEIKVLEKSSALQKNEKLTDCQRYVMYINKVKDSIQNAKGNVGKDLVDDMEELLIGLKNYLSEMLKDLYEEALDVDVVLEIVFTLLPGYTAVLYSFVKEYYFANHALPTNYQTFLEMFNELASSSYCDSIMDYIVLDKQMHINDAYDAFYAQAMIGLNDRTQIEDLASMLQLLENKEEYERVDADLERMAEAKMQVQTAEAAY